MAPINNTVGAARLMATPRGDAGSLARPWMLGEQTLYAATVRRFLDTSYVYLALPYIGSRRWYPSSGVFRWNGVSD